MKLDMSLRDYLKGWVQGLKPMLAERVKEQEQIVCTAAIIEFFDEVGKIEIEEDSINRLIAKRLENIESGLEKKELLRIQSMPLEIRTIELLKNSIIKDVESYPTLGKQEEPIISLEKVIKSTIYLFKYPFANEFLMDMVNNFGDRILKKTFPSYPPSEAGKILIPLDHDPTQDGFFETYEALDSLIILFLSRKKETLLETIESNQQIIRDDFEKIVRRINQYYTEWFANENDINVLHLQLSSVCEEVTKEVEAKLAESTVARPQFGH